MAPTASITASRSSVLLVHASAELYGSDRACLTCASAAAAAGFDAHVLLPVNGPLRPVLEAHGVTVHVRDSLVLRRADLRGGRAARTIMRWPLALWGLWRFSRRRRFALVHSNCMPTLGGAVLARWWRVPHIWHVHEIVRDERLTRLLFERMLSRADVVLAASQAIRDQFRLPRLRGRCRVAYTGGDADGVVAGTPPLCGGGVELTCVGRLSDRKGQKVLVEAVYQLRAAGRDVRLKLVGDVFREEHHFREGLERRISELGLQRWVSLLGERTDALELMAAADIVVVPSLQPEPFGIVVIEAMALGRPVVASDDGGPREIVTPGHDGLLVEPGDAVGLARAIGQLIDDPVTAGRMGQNGRRTAQRFRPERLAERTLEIYGELLAR